MKKYLAILAIGVSVSTAAPMAQAGCLDGAVVGGVGGHFLHHPLLGAAAGCVVGHHVAVVKKRRLQQQRYGYSRPY